MTTAAARLDLRLNPADKARISRAADLRGVPLSAFVRNAVMREAESVMAAELTVTLAVEESKRFLKALESKEVFPPELLRPFLNWHLGRRLLEVFGGLLVASNAGLLRPQLCGAQLCCFLVDAYVGRAQASVTKPLHERPHMFQSGLCA